MIRYLAIQRLAVIDAVTIEFEPGFNVLTGETGAGKSILVEALGLLLGARASADLVRTGEEQATVQAVFETTDGRERVIRREVSMQGRSRAFIDDELVTTAALRELGADLVDIHGQHEHQRLLDSGAHLDLLDAWAGLEAGRAAVAGAFAVLRDARSALDRQRLDDRDRAERLDLARFQLGEIERIAPRPGEDEELARTRPILASAERLQRLCDEAYATLYERDDSVLAALQQVWKRIEALAELEASFETHLEARASIKAQLEDLAHVLRSFRAGIDASPAHLQAVETRLAHLESLKKRFGPTLADVAARAARLSDDIDAWEHSEERTAALEQAYERARSAFLEAAGHLSSNRRLAASKFARRLERGLADLAMERARVEVRFAPADEAGDAAWSERGLDRAELYFSPNPGEELRPLARIVSGGELSRVMLAVRTLASPDAPGRTLVFDEVDAGIGGRVADAVGRRLQALGDRYQVLCVTHLPQIAARGTSHYRIDKSVRGNRTVTSVVCMDSGDRIEEIGRMIGGGRVTDTVRASARELLERPESEHNTKDESEGAKAKGRRVGQAIRN